MIVLIANVGSTSLKYGLYEMPSETLLARGRIERVGEDVSPCATWTEAGERIEEIPIKDFPAAIDYVKAELTDRDRGVLKSLSDLDAVGFTIR